MSTRYDYRAEDFTPAQVDAGQRKINFALTQADEKLVAVLVAVTNALKDPSGLVRDHVPAIEAAIGEASKAIKRVAEIIPPGCDPELP